MEMLSRTLDVFDRGPVSDEGLRAHVMSRLAQETYHVQRFTEARSRAAAALNLIPDESPPALRAAVLDGLAWTLHTPDDLEERMRLADEMVIQAERAGDPEWEMMGRSWRCTGLLEQGDAVAVDVELAHLSALERLAPVPSHMFRIATLRCTRAMMSGHFDTGAELAQRAHDIGAEIEPENALQTLCAQMLGMFREQGLLVGLVDMAEQMVADFPLVPAWKAALAFVNHEAGRIERAQSLFRELAAGGFAAIPRDLAWLQAHTYLAELAHAYADQPSAAVLQRLLVPFSGRNVGLYDIASNGAVDHYLGLLAATRGRRSTALRLLRRAVAFNDRSGQVPAATRSRVALAEVLLTGDRSDRLAAGSLLDVAATTAAACGLIQIGMEITDRRTRFDPVR
jgi:hypothetical protein